LLKTQAKRVRALHLGKKKRNEFLLFCTRFFVTLQQYSYNTKNKPKCRFIHNTKIIPK